MQRIGPYELLGEVGRGGAGVIYRARDPGLQRDVAIKLMSSARSQGGARLERFRREAEALARLRHPHVVKVHTAGEHQGLPYLVMDLIEGSSLAQRLTDEGPLPVQEALQIALSLSHALEHVHAHKLLHRDLKPDNVLLNKAGSPLLTDFGLAKDQGSDHGLSREGAVMGTPGYWPPEQARGQLDLIGPTADIYALGATLFAMLTGSPPVQGDSISALFVATCEQIPDPPSTWRAEIPPAVDAVCARCLAKAPRARYPDAVSLSAALEDALSGRPVGAGRAGRILPVLFVAVIALGAVTVWVGSRRPGSPAVYGPGASSVEPQGGSSGEPGLRPGLSPCLEALAAGEDRWSDAEALLLGLGSVPDDLLSRLEALPPGRSRLRLRVLAHWVAGDNAQAAGVAREGSPILQQAAGLALEARQLHESIDDAMILVGGPDASEAPTAMALDVLGRAERLLALGLGPVGVAAARRCQASLAHTVIRLRAVQVVDHVRLSPEFFERACGLVPGSVEADFVRVGQAWLSTGRDRGQADTNLLLGALVERPPGPGWDPLFVFVRGYVMLDTNSRHELHEEDAIAVGETAYQAGLLLPELGLRYGRQWNGLRGRLSEALVRVGGREMVFSGGGQGRERLERGFPMAMAALLGPVGAEANVPPLSTVTTAWLDEEIVAYERPPLRAGALALLYAGRPQQARALARRLRGNAGTPIGQLMLAEVELIRGEIKQGRERLERMFFSGQAYNYREFWGALAHSRHLGGDPRGVAEALAKGKSREATVGVLWHDPDVVMDLVEGRAWWPGEQSTPDGE